MHDDATLYGALRAACLVERADAEEETVVSSDAREITLDTTIEEEGLDLSLGQVGRFLTTSPDIDFTAIKSCSDAWSGWLVPWSRTAESSFWMKQLVRLSFHSLRDSFG